MSILKFQEFLQDSLDRGTITSDPVDSRGNSLLHLAVQYNLPDEFEKILRRLYFISDRSFSIFDVQPSKRGTILYQIIDSGNYRFLEILRRHILFVKYSELLAEVKNDELHLFNYLGNWESPFVIETKNASSRPESSDSASEYSFSNDPSNCISMSLYERHDNIGCILQYCSPRIVVDYCSSSSDEYLRQSHRQDYQKWLNNELQIARSELTSIENQINDNVAELKSISLNFQNKEHSSCLLVWESIEIERKYRKQLIVISDAIDNIKKQIEILQSSLYWEGLVEICYYKGYIFKVWKPMICVISQSTIKFYPCDFITKQLTLHEDETNKKLQTGDHDDTIQRSDDEQDDYSVSKSSTGGDINHLSDYNQLSNHNENDIPSRKHSILDIIRTSEDNANPLDSISNSKKHKKFSNIHLNDIESLTITGIGSAAVNKSSSDELNLAAFKTKVEIGQKFSNISVSNSNSNVINHVQLTLNIRSIGSLSNNDKTTDNHNQINIRIFNMDVHDSHSDTMDTRHTDQRYQASAVSMSEKSQYRGVSFNTTSKPVLSHHSSISTPIPIPCTRSYHSSTKTASTTSSALTTLLSNSDNIASTSSRSPMDTSAKNNRGNDEHISQFICQDCLIRDKSSIGNNLAKSNHSVSYSHNVIDESINSSWTSNIHGFIKVLQDFSGNNIPINSADSSLMTDLYHVDRNDVSRTDSEIISSLNRKSYSVSNWDESFLKNDPSHASCLYHCPVCHKIASIDSFLYEYSRNDIGDDDGIQIDSSQQILSSSYDSSIPSRYLSSHRYQNALHDRRDDHPLYLTSLPSLYETDDAISDYDDIDNVRQSRRTLESSPLKKSSPLRTPQRNTFSSTTEETEKQSYDMNQIDSIVNSNMLGTVHMSMMKNRRLSQKFPDLSDLSGSYQREEQTKMNTDHYHHHRFFDKLTLSELRQTLNSLREQRHSILQPKLISTIDTREQYLEQVRYIQYLRRLVDRTIRSMKEDGKNQSLLSNKRSSLNNTTPSEALLPEFQCCMKALEDNYKLKLEAFILRQRIRDFTTLQNDMTSHIANYKRSAQDHSKPNEKDLFDIEL